jgi:transcription elongation factor GreB
MGWRFRFLWSECYFGSNSMNKAFTKETDPDDDELIVPSAPAAGKNYITPAGYERLRAELLALIDDERPKVVEIVHWAASNGDRSENGDYIYGKKRLREIDRRIRFLTQRLEIAVITNPSVHHGKDQVYFGATVAYLDDMGIERQVTILGIDEADTLQGQISWVSPVARALLKSKVDDEVNLITPHGLQVLDVLRVNYPHPS